MAVQINTAPTKTNFHKEIQKVAIDRVMESFIINGKHFREATSKMADSPFSFIP